MLGEDKQMVGGGGKDKIVLFLCHSGHVARINDQLFRERTGCGDLRNQVRA